MQLVKQFIEGMIYKQVQSLQASCIKGCTSRRTMHSGQMGYKRGEVQLTNEKTPTQ